MRAYRYTDLCNWEDLGLFIQPDLTDKDAPLYPTSRADRPHIVKCAYTGKDVCWITAVTMPALRSCRPTNS